MNLVKLIGCYIHGEERILIYEYMPNKSLDCFLFGKKNNDFYLLSFQKKKSIYLYHFPNRLLITLIVYIK